MIGLRAATFWAVAMVLSLASAVRGQGFIFAEGTSPEEQARYIAALAEQTRGDSRYVTTTRWPGTTGEAAVIRFSYVPDGLPIPAPPGVAGGASPSILFTTLDAQFLNLGGRARWQNVIGRPATASLPDGPIISGGVFLWQAAGGVRFPFIRRLAGVDSSDNATTNFWDDGATWGASGPLHPPTVQSTLITITLGAPLTGANIVVNGATTAQSLTITANPGNISQQFQFSDPTSNTLSKLVSKINTIQGLSAVLGAGANPNANPRDFAIGQSLGLNGGTPSGNLLSTLTPTFERGDIRIAMRPLPAAIIAYTTAPAADGGDIILNSTLNWTAGSGARFLQNAIARGVGEAIGLGLSCPNDKTKMMEPVLNLAINAVGIDDIRAVQRLYGDALNRAAAGFTGGTVNSTPVTEPNDDPTIVVPQPGGPWDLGNVNVVNPLNHEVGLSMDDVTDIDYFQLTVGNPTDLTTVISFDVKVTAAPQGGTYTVGPNAGGCTGTAFNATNVYNLQVGIFDAAGTPIANGSPTAGAAFQNFINTRGVGQDEIAQVTLTRGAVIIVGVAATGTASTESQLYNLRLEFTNRNLAAGVPLGPVVSDYQIVNASADDDTLEGPSGHGALTFGTDNTGSPFFYNTNYTGERARFATVESNNPDANHIAFGGRPITVVRWTGVNPALDSIDDHATATTGAGTGTTTVLGNSYFRGVAPGAQIFSSNVAQSTLPGGSFFPSVEATYYALFALSDPLISASIGLPQPVTVINSSYGALGDSRGDSTTALAYDAVVSMTGVTAVVSAGNSGDIDNSATCQGPGGDIPGGPFYGGRTVGSPGTAFNVLTVGAAGKGYSDPPPDPDGPVPGGGGGGGGSRPSGTRGAGSGAPEDPTTIGINTIPQFSSKGPVDTFSYSTTAPGLNANTRPGVHIVAAGTGIIKRDIDPSLLEDVSDPCDVYVGHQPIAGLSLPILDPNVNNRFAALDGTSFSAPIVAGAVALLQDFGLSRVPQKSINSLVMRSVLMTSAVKMPGWSNSGAPAKPQDNRDGRTAENPDDLINDQNAGAGRVPLDLAQGAGLLSIPYAFAVYGVGDLQDSPLTDPTKPTQTPADEIVPPPFPNQPNRPGSGAAASTGQFTPDEEAEMRQLMPADPDMTAAQLELIRKGILDTNRGLEFRDMRPDFTDPVITPGGGTKSGAGLFDPRESFISGAGTVPGSFSGGGPPAVKPVLLPTSIFGGYAGWDHANLGIKPLRLRSGSRVGGVMDYVIYVPFVSATPGPNDYITATLVWNRTVTVKKPNFTLLDNPGVGNITHLELENLDLELYQTPDGEVFDGQEPLAFSRTTLGNIEHLHYQLITPGFYVLRVTYANRHFDLFRNLPPGGVEYGVSWAWRPILDSKVGGTVLPAPQDTPAARGVGTALLSEVLLRFGARIGEAGYSGLADVNQDSVVDSRDLIWVISRLQAQQAPQASAHNN